TAPYNGAQPFPGADISAPMDAQRAVRISVTGLIVLGPFVGLGVAIWTQWGHGLGAADLVLGAFFYLLTGFGVTAGFHRCLTHRSYTARPALRAALAIAGSMSFRRASAPGRRRANTLRRPHRSVVMFRYGRTARTTRGVMLAPDHTACDAVCDAEGIVRRAWEAVL